MRAAGGSGPAPRAEPAGDWGLLAMRPDPALSGRQWIDPQNDVTLKDVALAAREGYVSVEHLKRYTTLGMATDQGRNANFAGLAAMAALTGRSDPRDGHHHLPAALRTRSTVGHRWSSPWRAVQSREAPGA